MNISIFKNKIIVFYSFNFFLNFFIIKIFFLKRFLKLNLHQFFKKNESFLK
jgi:hypothetical protein